jgi:hypothetical protein
MANGGPIELASLLQRHPRCGDALLNLFGAQVVLRLALDPVRQARGTLVRDVAVDRRSPSTGGHQVREAHQIGWHGLPQYSEDYCIRVSRTVNAERLTEDAAIGVMALLIHALEGVTIQEVLQIGSGGDYLIVLGGRRRVQVEVSGIREDAGGSESGSRLTRKTHQVLSHSPAGYVSVTTFHLPSAGGVHSYLHYAEQARSPKGRKGKGKGRKK